MPGREGRLMNKIIQGDCLEVLKTMPDNSVDSLVTDPPYGISFMGKKWDYDIPSVDVWREALRVLKPGGHALIACGTRTQHRMACAIEDAGFEIRDTVAWLYGSGFPKSLNISKAVDKSAGIERNFAEHTRVDTGFRFQAGQTGALPAQTPEAKQWSGWGTALKPAMELWTLCRKPLSEPTGAANVLKWGTGGINVDGCRVGTDDKYSYPNGAGGNSFSVGEKPDGKRTKSVENNLLGRFPANIIHDGSDEVVEGFPQTKSGWRNTDKGNTLDGNTYNNRPKNSTGNHFADSGSAARFFKCCPENNERKDLLLYHAKAILSEIQTERIVLWKNEIANAVDDSSCLPSQLVASVLNDVVIGVSHGDRRLSDLMGLSMSVTPMMLRHLCESVIVKMLSTESESLQGSFHIATVKLESNPAKFAEIPKPTDTTMTITNPTISDGSAVVATLNIMQKSMDRGEVASASRIKYCAKASKAERNAGLEGFEEKARPTMGSGIGGQPDQQRANNKNIHPTIKPIALMRYLCRLITPSGGTVIDPFMGSGSTGIATKLEGLRFIGIEREAEYCRIAEARIAAWEPDKQQELGI